MWRKSCLPTRSSYLWYKHLVQQCLLDLFTAFNHILLLKTHFSCIASDCCLGVPSLFPFLPSQCLRHLPQANFLSIFSPMQSYLLPLNFISMSRPLKFIPLARSVEILTCFCKSVNTLDFLTLVNVTSIPSADRTRIWTLLVIPSSTHLLKACYESPSLYGNHPSASHQHHSPEPWL